MKVYLGDLVHTWEKASTWTFPLNIGFISAYAKKHLKDDVEFRLFKRPEKMIDAIKEDAPDVVALAHYVWNSNLNSLVARIAKKHNPKVLNIAGGPNFTSINTNDKQCRAVFERQPELDAYVVNQGERGFLEVLQTYLSLELDLNKLRNSMVGGCVTNGDVGPIIGPSLDAIRDLDEIPSPYLTGILDEFFDEPFAPVLETNRSCPYRCTFCAWGIGTSKLSRFSEERVVAEIDYIGRHCNNAAQMFIADANFGILKRDAFFARHLNDSHKKYGFPGHLAVQWHKSRPDLIVAAAREVKDIARIGASMQSMNSETLDAVKRKNLPLDQVLEMHKELNEGEKGMPLVSELILGLPEETRETHLEANRTMIDAGAEMINYNLYLLPGTEMDTEESREKFFKTTGWRLMDNAFGVYDGVPVFEGQETVQATSTMSLEELRGFRFYHFLLQFMWGGRWYFDYINLFKDLGLHPVDLIDRICQEFPRDDSALGRMYQDFKSDHDLETFTTYDEMCNYWSEPENLERLRTGGYGKLNYAFTYKVLLEVREEFDQFLLDLAGDFAKELCPDEKDNIQEICREVLLYGSVQQVKLTREMSLIPEIASQFEYDILAWRENEYQGFPKKVDNGNACTYSFKVSDEQYQKLNRFLHQYKSHNVNLTLRKMSEYIKPHEFFYTASVLDDAAGLPSVEKTGIPLVPQSGTHDSWTYLNQDAN